MKKYLTVFLLISVLATGCSSSSTQTETTAHTMVEESTDLVTEVSIPDSEIVEPSTVPETEEIKIMNYHNLRYT